MPSTLSSEAPTSLSRCLSNGFPPVEAPSGEKSSPGVEDEPEGKNIFLERNVSNATRLGTAAKRGEPD
jgi:hypothetical protein